MSHITKYYLSEVLKAICDTLKDVSKNVYPDHRPNGKGIQSSDLIVVSIPNELKDLNVQQSGTVRFDLAAKNKATGVADITKLQKLLDALAAKFPITEKRFTVTRPRVTLKGDDGLGFTIWSLQADLKINTTDSYSYE